MDTFDLRGASSPASGFHAVSWIRRRALYLGAALFGMCAMLWVISGSPFLPSTDTYYHLKMARLLPSLGFIHAFPWLHWTFFRDHFVSHHFGFHVLLAPLVWVSEQWTGDLVLGGKAAVTLGMGLTAAFFCAILRARSLSHALAWTCLLGCLPWHFWMRLAYVRAPIMALPLLLLAALLFIRQKPWGLFICGCLFSWLYLGAVTAALIPAAFLAGHLLGGSWTRRLWDCAILFGLGLAAGLVISPYFPDNLSFLWVQMFSAGFGATTDVPSEWLPFNAWFFLKICAPLLVIWLCALVYRLRQPAPLDGAAISLLVLNLLFFLMTVKSRRFIEYWPVFALLSAADLARFSLKDFDALSGLRLSRLKHAEAWLAAMAIAVSIPGLSAARANAHPRDDQRALCHASQFLARHSPAGSLALTDDWDIFPVCFYYNHHNRYCVGLDPMFTMIQYPEKWQAYRRVTRGQGSPDLHEIKSVFGADYVLVLRDHEKLYRQLGALTNRFELIYPSNWDVESAVQPEASVFRVRQAQADFVRPSP